MGIGRLLLLLAVMLSFASGPAAAAPAASPFLALADAACTAGGDSVEAAFAVDESSLDCGPNRFDRRERFARARVELAKGGVVPAGRLIWQTNPTGFDSMLVRLDYADGTQRLVDVDAQMAVRNWDANGTFWVPVQQRGAPLTAVDVVVERPNSRAVFTRMTLSSLKDASRANHNRQLLYMLLCGILLVPIIYDLLFYRILGARFLLWHLAMAVGTLLYTLFSSGMVMVVAPDIPSFVRHCGSWLAISLTMMGTVRFSFSILEEGMVSRPVRRFLNYAVLANIVIAFLLPFEFEALRMLATDLYVISVLPIIGGMAVLLGIATLRDSRVALFLSAAFGGLMVAGTAQVLAVLDLFPRSDGFDEALYAALVILVLGSFAAVGDRFLVIKAERDHARVTARKLGAMANTDGLTGLLNRRAFDQSRRLGRGLGLLIADIDRFKAINDTYGHQRGDAVLCHAARTIEGAVRALGGGEVYRLGGEEFAILTPAVTRQQLEAAAEAIRVAIDESAQGPDAYDMPEITISVGAVQGEGQLMHVAFAEADGALYRAKEGGRNRCVIAEGPVD